MNEFIKLSFKNKGLILESEKCACYHCKTIMKNSEIEYLEEADGKETAVCPHCGIDSVIDEKSVQATGKELDADFLDALNKEAF